MRNEIQILIKSIKAHSDGRELMGGASIGHVKLCLYCSFKGTGPASSPGSPGIYLLEQSNSGKSVTCGWMMRRSYPR